MDRRSMVKNVMAGGIAVAGASFAKGALGSEFADGGASAPTALERVRLATAACLRTGESCVAHCGLELGRGNTSMAHCNQRVHDMLATCQAMLRLASYNSDLAVALATVCAEACRRCRAACNEHKDHFAHGMHLECKACMEACIECEAACLALAA